MRPDPDVRADGGREPATGFPRELICQGRTDSLYRRQENYFHLYPETPFGLEQVDWKAFLAQEIFESARTAENRLSPRVGHSAGTDPGTLFDRRAQRDMEPGQRRRHAEVPGRSRMAE